ncbi:DGQHR domain-containing protein [Planococcus kocurii]|uniref:DGQHR domain-containing protein n=1 Tax=Planococcus kocurii TaxID=1374 RepID=UPI003CFDB83E
MIKLNLLEVNQPIGTFYIGVLNADVIERITDVNRRTEGRGPQRELSKPKVKEIKEYCSDPDAAFPTPIIISLYDSEKYNFENNELTIYGDEVIGEIIDGQHRAKGISEAYNTDAFDLPVVFMFNLTEEEKAYVFSIINSKQTRVSMSLIYDLFSISKSRSPQKTCHEITRLLNTDKDSPFYRRLKMLGKKEGELSSLSQGSFIRYLIPLISNHPDKDARELKTNPNKKLNDNEDKPFRYYFINNQDENIYLILVNLFNAVKETFPEEWESPNKYILSKTTGYGAVLRAFPEIYKLGMKRKTLDFDFFLKCFEAFKAELNAQRKELTSEYFPSNEQEQKKLSNIIIQAIQKRKI